MFICYILCLGTVSDPLLVLMYVHLFYNFQFELVCKQEICIFFSAFFCQLSFNYGLAQVTFSRVVIHTPLLLFFDIHQTYCVVDLLLVWSIFLYSPKELFIRLDSTSNTWFVSITVCNYRYLNLLLNVTYHPLSITLHFTFTWFCLYRAQYR